VVVQPDSSAPAPEQQRRYQQGAQLEEEWQRYLACWTGCAVCKSAMLNWCCMCTQADGVQQTFVKAHGATSGCVCVPTRCAVSGVVLSGWIAAMGVNAAMVMLKLGGVLLDW
jgi:hypothetical protein